MDFWALRSHEDWELFMNAGTWVARSIYTGGEEGPRKPRLAAAYLDIFAPRPRSYVRRRKIGRACYHQFNGGVGADVEQCTGGGRWKVGTWAW